MIKKAVLIWVLLVTGSYAGAQNHSLTDKNEIFWKLQGPHAIVWDLTKKTPLPHTDHMEMDGKRVACIITYKIDKNKMLKLEREIIFPQLRVYIQSRANYWSKYRAYLKATYGDNLLPVITLEQRTFVSGPVDSVRIDGMLRFYHHAVQGIRTVRTLLPSMSERLFTEIWTLTNITDSVKKFHIGKNEWLQEEEGANGRFRRQVYCDTSGNIVLNAGAKLTFAVGFRASLNEEPFPQDSYRQVLFERNAFLDTVRRNLVLETPDSIINLLFEFSKIRAAESIYETEKMGLVHSPGGGRYYTGVWANDQAEYSSPFFPYLGYKTGNIAAFNAYRQFLNNIPHGNGHFWSSYEMGGTLHCCGMDRGDAAMIAFGATHFALANGNRQQARQLWPLISRSLDYCERQKNKEGVVTSESDEMEGRVPTGTANLATSSLYYGALRQAAVLAGALNKPQRQKEYLARADNLGKAIENYFGAEIEGLHTYRYFKDYPYLRHWICLPLVVGINDRKEGTLDALFSKLWTDNGIKVEDKPEPADRELFWDRGTLYAFRGAFKAGAAERALEKLHAFSQTRLLGFHVPYVVEAWPEGNMAHLSAESALYVRIFTEGVLGMVPTGFRSFDITPRLPPKWDFFNLKHIRAFNSDFDILIRQKNEKLQIKIVEQGKTILNKSVKTGDTVHVDL